MKSLIKRNVCLSLGVILLTFRTGAQDIGPPDSDAREKKIISSVQERVERGDLAAMDDLKSLPLPTVLTVLEPYAAKTSRESLVVHSAAIRQMVALKVEPIYAERLKSFAKGREAGVAIILHRLGEFKTKEAVRIIASYLNDDRVPDMDSYDVRHSAYSIDAAIALGKAGFADAPVNKGSFQYTREDVALWREWWKVNRLKFEEP